jgi:AcrR family transcriptional regulator
VPKVVDHEQRRRLIAIALWRIAARQGLEAASLTEVAAEAGVSKGMVQHYFRTRDEMLLFAIRHADERLRDRIERRLAAQSEPQPAAALRALALALLPTDEDSRTGALVSIAFFIRSLSSVGLADALQEGYTQLAAQLRAQITAGQESGQLNLSLSAQHEAHILLALVGGLTSSILAGHLNTSAATTIVDYHLARLTA